MRKTPAICLEDLLDEIAQGNRAAFDVLYRSTAKWLFVICVRVLTQHPDAEDALQDAFTAVWNKASKFDRARANAPSWLALIARNKAVDRLRAMPPRQVRANLKRTGHIEDPRALPSLQAQTASDRAQLEHCLEFLEPYRRSLIRAAFFEDLTYEELAAKIEVPLGSVKSSIRRGLIQLRQRLNCDPLRPATLQVLAHRATGLRGAERLLDHDGARDSPGPKGVRNAVLF